MARSRSSIGHARFSPCVLGIAALIGLAVAAGAHASLPECGTALLKEPSVSMPARWKTVPSSPFLQIDEAQILLNLSLSKGFGFPSTTENRFALAAVSADPAPPSDSMAPADFAGPADPAPPIDPADISKPEEPRAKAAMLPVPDPVHSMEVDLQVELERHRQMAEDLFKMIAKAESGGEPAAADAYYLKILSLHLPADMESRALFEFASYLDEKKASPVKAAAVYEKCLSTEPSSSRVPVIQMRLADIYHQLGAEGRSLNKLYEVLSSSIRSADDPKGGNLARQAMLKIGNTHFDARQYDEAAGIYSRLKLLDLSPEDQAFVLFRATDLLFRRNQYEAAIEAGRQFLAQYPRSKFVPDCRQMIVQSLNASGHRDEAIQETLALLLSTQADPGIDPALAAYWKMKTGNDLANALYSHGEFLRALHMYQTVANLSNEPAWKLSAVFQIGLSFERLRELRRAIDAYRYVAKATPPAAGPGKPPPETSGISLRHLKESADWRARNLEWLVDVGTKLYPILSSKIRNAPGQPRESKE